MKALWLGIAAAALASAPAANAATATINGITITQIGWEDPGTFNNNPVGAFSGASAECDSAYCGGITFTSELGVSQGSSNTAAAPANDGTHYLAGVKVGSQVWFDKNANSFNFYWGSIDAANPPANRYDNVLTVFGSLGGSGAITGSDLLGLGWADGLGNRTNAADNQWFNVKLASGETINSFLATSSQNAFEFDMAVPEPSTWAMMGFGFAALGYAAFRRAKKATPALA